MACEDRLKRRVKDKLARKKAAPKAKPGYVWEAGSRPFPPKRAAGSKRTAPATGTGVCKNLPDCRACGSPACEHEFAGAHAMKGCAAYRYPDGWGVCARPRCGLASTEHGKAEPHPMPYSACTEFVFAPGITAAAFVAGGGRFGGGGATGGW